MPGSSTPTKAGPFDATSRLETCESSRETCIICTVRPLSCYLTNHRLAPLYHMYPCQDAECQTCHRTSVL
jgi:hypothetical protein